MPHDYKKPHQSILGAQLVDSQPANTIRHMNPGGAASNINEEDARMRIPYTCTIRNLYVRSSGPPGAGETFTYAIMVNGFASALICQIAGAVDIEDNDLVNVSQITLGDEISFRITSSLNAAAVRHSLSLEVDR